MKNINIDINRHKSSRKMFENYNFYTYLGNLFISFSFLMCQFNVKVINV